SVINLNRQVQQPIFSQLLAGALLFVLSDSLIAINKFGHPFNGARLMIMVTYLLGQFLLVSGARRTH
ncbi:MAG TPA: lysoplasmalogenase family protein, partial [Saprospiraceae bacterium]|nr:lysoplasmalogenase family protein [Saprospiraceae bacterium]